jgi:hypothetical protein
MCIYSLEDLDKTYEYLDQRSYVQSGKGSQDENPMDQKEVE